MNISMQKKVKRSAVKEWVLQADAASIRESDAVREIADALMITRPTAQLLLNRGCATPEDARMFLAKAEEMFHDPFAMKDMREAAETVLGAVAEGEKIAVFGDYDVDGVTSVCCLQIYLRSLGANVTYYIPSRTGEGYGMSENAVRKLAEDGVGLIITVDTGITAQTEARVAAELGITLVITDHHECHGEIPEAAAVVNPHRPDDTYPFKELAGVGVVFKLLCALESCRDPEKSMASCVRAVAMQFADLVAIGTVADVMPIRDENRLIVALGLQLIERSPREGVRALLDATANESKSKQPRRVSSSLIGFTIAPRINAAGRLRDASAAVELFMESDPEQANYLAHKLCDINRERQNEENKIVDVAYARIDAEHDFEKDPVIVVADEHWHHGIIGIVSSRITDKYGCPSILISFDKGEESEPMPDDAGKGSGRSIKGMNLVDALAACSDLLVKFGGHELAAGLTVRREDLPAFKERLNDYARTHFTDGVPVQTVDIECELTDADLTMRQVEELYELEPYGVSNPVPVFVTFDMTVADVAAVGAGKHLRMKLTAGDKDFTAMYFRHGLADIDVYPGDRIDVLYTLDINEFQGRKSLQMIVKEFRLSESIAREEDAAHEVYNRVTDSLAAGKTPAQADAAAVTPNRSECGIVYNTLKHELHLGHEVFSIRALLHLLRTSGYDIPYGKLKMILRVFSELNLIEVKENDSVREIYTFRYVYLQGKTSLDKSVLLQTLQAAAGDQMPQ